MLDNVHHSDSPAVMASKKMLNDLKLSSDAKVLYLALRFGLWPSPAAAGKDSGLGPTATRSALRKLEEAGYITIDQPRRDGGKFTGQQVRILPENNA